MLDHHFHIDSDMSLETAFRVMREWREQGIDFNAHFTNEKEKTEAQFNAMHVWCRQLANALNDAGLDMKKVLKQEVDIPWTDISVKKFMWKPILKALTGKESTTKMNTVNPDEVYRVICRHLSENEATAGLEIPPWPTRFNQMEAA